MDISGELMTDGIQMKLMEEQPAAQAKQLIDYGSRLDGISLEIHRLRDEVNSKFEGVMKQLVDMNATIQNLYKYQNSSPQSVFNVGDKRAWLASSRNRSEGGTIRMLDDLGAPAAMNEANKDQQQPSELEQSEKDQLQPIEPEQSCKDQQPHTEPEESSKNLHLRPRVSSGQLREQQCMWNREIMTKYARKLSISPVKVVRKSIPAIEKRCLHCGSSKTPQWRAGPLGPRTLCNACGVRYKSGRLLPEYRPAGSPTFSPALHSNSHREIMEMRQQKQIADARVIVKEETDVVWDNGE